MNINIPTTTEFDNLHPVLMLTLGPLLGALFVIFLPILGFGLLGYAMFVAIKRNFNKLVNKPVQV